MVDIVPKSPATLTARDGKVFEILEAFQAYSWLFRIEMHIS